MRNEGWGTWEILALIAGIALLGSGGYVIYTQTRGLRNNNPGNIKYSSANNWEGQTGQDSDGFAIFSSAEYGVRALGHILMSYAGQGLTSVSAIISQYSATDQSSYIANVASALGIDPNASIDVEAQLPQLAAAIITQENGLQPYSSTDLDNWVTMA